MAELTEAEAAVYDRQLRVWGVEVQKRLRSARVLIINCTGLAAEVAKNIVLAGVGSLHLMDDTPSPQASPANFLNFPHDPSASVAVATARSLTEMNPMVSISAIDIEAQPSHNLVRQYDVILTVGKPLGALLTWSSVCRENKVPFLAAVSRGTQAFFFQDFGIHTFQPPDKEGQVQEVRTVSSVTLADALKQSWNFNKRTHSLVPVILLCAMKERESGDFVPYSQSQDLQAFGKDLARAQSVAHYRLDQSALDAYLSTSEELAPVNAIVGGILANEVLKIVSKKGEPVNNVFCYSMLDGSGVIEQCAPPAQENELTAPVSNGHVMNEVAKNVPLPPGDVLVL